MGRPSRSRHAYDDMRPRTVLPSPLPCGDAPGADAGRYGQASAMIDRAHGHRRRRSADSTTRSGVNHGMPSMRPSSMARSARRRASAKGRVDVMPAAAKPSRRASASSGSLTSVPSTRRGCHSSAAAVRSSGERGATARCGGQRHGARRGHRRGRASRRARLRGGAMRGGRRRRHSLAGGRGRGRAAGGAGRRRHGGPLLLDRHRREHRGEQGSRCARCLVRRCRDGARRTPLERRESACAGTHQRNIGVRAADRRCVARDRGRRSGGAAQHRHRQPARAALRDAPVSDALPRLLCIMGSGETAPTMTSVHADLLGRLGPPPVPAVLLDTPFGFQENATDICNRAMAYFRDNVGNPITIASFRNRETATPLEYETMLARIAEARYAFAGPGSPTYALRQWRDTRVPELLTTKLRDGGCVTFASAAACGLGVVALPVYEVYKVGEAPHWLEGMDLLSAIGLRVALIPHYNNAEGGTHDTRFCYMGERRLRMLESMLDEGAAVLGVDEHTACILDLDAETVSVRGNGGVTLRRGGRERRLESGVTAPLDALRPGGA